MRIRIRVDVGKPLKRKKKIIKKNGSEFILNCKYGRIWDFCFLYGLLTHIERFVRRSSNGHGRWRKNGDDGFEHNREGWSGKVNGFVRR